MNYKHQTRFHPSAQQILLWFAWLGLLGYKILSAFLFQLRSPTQGMNRQDVDPTGQHLLAEATPHHWERTPFSGPIKMISRTPSHRLGKSISAWTGVHFVFCTVDLVRDCTQMDLSTPNGLGVKHMRLALRDYRLHQLCSLTSALPSRKCSKNFDDGHVFCDL